MQGHSIRTYRHTYIHACMHACMHTCKHACTHLEEENVEEGLDVGGAPRDETVKGGAHVLFQERQRQICRDHFPRNADRVQDDEACMFVSVCVCVCWCVCVCVVGGGHERACLHGRVPRHARRMRTCSAATGRGRTGVTEPDDGEGHELGVDGVESIEGIADELSNAPRHQRCGDDLRRQAGGHQRADSRVAQYPCAGNRHPAPALGAHARHHLLVALLCALGPGLERELAALGLGEGRERVLVQRVLRAPDDRDARKHLARENACEMKRAMAAARGRGQARRGSQGAAQHGTARHAAARRGSPG